MLGWLGSRMLLACCGKAGTLIVFMVPRDGGEEEVTKAPRGCKEGPPGLFCLREKVGGGWMGWWKRGGACEGEGRGECTGVCAGVLWGVAYGVVSCELCTDMSIAEVDSGLFTMLDGWLLTCAG